MRKGISMGTFMAACLAVWLVVVLYLGRMGWQQRRMQRTLEALEASLNVEADRRKLPANAASKAA
jgi:hypothetical protein